MPSAAADVRTGRSPTIELSASNENRVDDRPRPRLGTGLLHILTRLAGAGEDTRTEPAELTAVRSRRPPNRCEFDYDYYVALQSRRQHQPSRLSRRSSPDRRD